MALSINRVRARQNSHQIAKSYDKLFGNLYDAKVDGYIRCTFHWFNQRKSYTRVRDSKKVHSLYRLQTPKSHPLQNP